MNWVVVVWSGGAGGGDLFNPVPQDKLRFWSCLTHLKHTSPHPLQHEGDSISNSTDRKVHFPNWKRILFTGQKSHLPWTAKGERVPDWVAHSQFCRLVSLYSYLPPSANHRMHLQALQIHYRRHYSDILHTHQPSSVGETKEYICKPHDPCNLWNYNAETQSFKSPSRYIFKVHLNQVSAEFF